MRVAHILQSGFLTWPTADLVKSESAGESFKDSLYTPDYQVIDTENYYDKGVEHLFTLWRKDDNRVNTFEFREAIILTALRVFREKTIVPWLRLQLSNSSMSYLHRKYLTETFRSILCNEPRTLDNMQYYQLLHPTLSQPTTPISEHKIEDIIDERSHSDSLLVADIVFNWTEDIDGVCDLLSTLHVIFGKRAGVSSVSTK